MNARWEDEQIIDQPEIHIGVAVDVEAGLLVPVIRNVPQLRVSQIAATTKDLVARARAGALTSAELQGGTFTITNLGMYGIDAFTPIINPPETAILGLGAIRREATFEGEKLVPRDLLTLSLTFDHRVVDGAPAARFLQSLVRAIEHAAAFLA
jgi:pyruvate dehydrogenase E2 component (dihydrolipoamide acetyltransferase)